MIADSLGLPRIKPESLNFEETYFSLLSENFHDIRFVSMFHGGATISQLYSSSAHYIDLNPELVIVQSGVVDCAPRAFRKAELEVVMSWGKRFSKPILKQLRKYRNIRYTSPSMFRTKIKALQQRFGKDKLFWISIMPASDPWEEIVPGIQKSVNLYNNILKEECGKNLLFENAELSWLMSDNHHLNQFGHKKIYEGLANILNDEI